jgi:glutamyl-Q tRNA(Asp) synthetase
LPYVGRFAPSPTGPLHLGSLTTAVASYLHARQAGGEWLLRVEDIDPLREPPDAAADILRALEAFGLHWDRDVLYQRARFAVYRSAAQALLDRQVAFRCSCSRKDVEENAGGGRRYPGTCRFRTAHVGATAIRVLVEPGIVGFRDGLQGQVEADLSETEGDYVVYRRDELPAYHLAVVLDDHWQGVDTIVRGTDLLQPTLVHGHLRQLLGLPEPRYFHLPVVSDRRGVKLSKQTGAVPIGVVYSPETAVRALELLGLEVPDEARGAPGPELWAWAVPRWRIEELIGRQSIHIA